MKIQDLFEKDIHRPINGVIKADQLDESSVWQELDEFVVTRELTGHVTDLVDLLLSTMESEAEAVDKNGIWVSGFFGCGKSHFIKVMSYLLDNEAHEHAGESRRAVDFFKEKLSDPLLYADLKKVVAAPTDTILFNVDSKADHTDGRDALLRVFLKVLNEKQGYSGDHPHIAHMERHLEEKGVEVLTGETVLRIEGEEGGDGRARRVVTNQRSLPADIVILAAGVRPNSRLAKEAGLELSAHGGIVVNERLQTSDPDIYAGGDCVENRSLVTGGPVFTPLGSLANRHGRVIAACIAGREERFPGVVGSFIVKVFDLCLAAAGLSQEEAIAAGFDAERVLTVGYDRAHFMPEKALMFLQLIVDRADRRVLGIQGVGKANDAVAVRIDAVAALLKHHPAVEEISNLELAYSPPFASAMDSLNALGNTAANLLDGLYRRMTVGEAMEHLHGGDEEVLFLDLNAPRQAKPYLELFPGQWINIPYENLASRIDEVPRDKTIVTICDSGIRSYESQVLLSARGYPSVYAMEGGLNLLRKLGLDAISPSTKVP
jgi:rhodanese-related sulfurtransferase